MRTLHRKRGFTIVELLIVIVVIGILAGITIVGYSFVIKNAADSTLKSDLNEVTDSLEAENFDTGYPSSLSAINNGAGPSVTNGTVLRYTGTPTSYCLTAFSAKANGPFYKKSGSGSIQSGACPGHTNP